MNKKEFLQLLKLRLLESNVTPTDGILNYYSQKIDSDMRNGMTEMEAVRDQGDIDEIVATAILDKSTPANIARNIIEEREKPSRKSSKNSRKKHYKLLWLIVAICLFPVWIPFIIRYGRTTEKTYESKSKVESIEIEERSGSVSVVCGDVENPVVNYSENKRKRYEIKEENGVLKIEQKHELSGFFFWLNFSSEDLTVTVPRDYKGEISVKNTSGSTKIDSITAKDITVNNTSGSIKIKDTEVTNDISVTNTSGSIQISDCSADNIDVKNTSGSIRFDSTMVLNDFTAKGTSGSIKLNELKTGGNIKVSNTSGSIKGTIIGSEDDYKITAQTTSGSCNLENTNKGDKELTCEVKSGSINIEFED